MKITIISVGKDHEDAYEDAIKLYTTRLLHYAPVEWIFVDHKESKDKESEKILDLIKKEDYVILLDEKGSAIKSEDFFNSWLRQKLDELDSQ